jgi:hypothetical protein
MGEKLVTPSHPRVRAEEALGNLKYGEVTPELRLLVFNLCSIIDRLEKKNKRLENLNRFSIPPEEE